VQSGVTPKETEIQSNCLIFRDGLVQSYNGEIAATFESTLEDEVHGAVKAAKMVNYLQKLTVEDIEVEGSDTEMRIKCGKESVGFPLEKEVLLPVDSIEQPDEWKQLPDGFLDAVNVVQQCASPTSDKAPFITTVIHVHPKWLEAADSTQLIRYRIATPIITSALIRQSALKNIVSLGVTEFAETKTWTHFRNVEGLIYSCRCYLEAYPSDEVTAVLKSDDGHQAVLPKGLAEIAAKANIFSEDAKVFVELSNRRLRVRGQGAGGEWYDSGAIKVVYEGEPLKFLIAPKLLGELAAKHNEVMVSEKLLKIRGSGWRYATALGYEPPSEEREAENGGEPSEA
jgi:hypothetical protein